ncbi:hypothetical protein FSP39_017001 [Pinctada imbricata]|uniref:Charged multivesicular body protein 3 n=1 Tax=Pinctada imbricata TaxID=66713 RepID=A0AA88Y588_PINIB|nr:hypothetical protein FSP39_017001 [Pinctada imbricata]
MGLFGKEKQKSPKDQVNEWTHKIRKEGYVLDRQIRSIQREEEKVRRQIKDSAKKGEKEACKILAKEVIRSRKAVNRLYASKAHMNSVQMSMKNQLATLRIAGALEKSTEVMNSMQALIKIPEIQSTMREMSKEMMKAGILEEMLDDTMESLDDDELDDEADEAVEAVIMELTTGELKKAPLPMQDSLAVPEDEGATALPADEEEDEDLTNRLEALRS